MLCGGVSFSGQTDSAQESASFRHSVDFPDPGSPSIRIRFGSCFPLKGAKISSIETSLFLEIQIRRGEMIAIGAYSKGFGISLL
jgi:hypothetical protein